jgi:hypothetical protein
MPETVFSDEWLVHSLEGLLTPERLAEVEAAGKTSTLWETMVKEKLATNEQIPRRWPPAFDSRSPTWIR